MRDSYYERCGSFSIAVLDLMQDDDFWWVTRISVPPAFRGKGIGSRLLTQVCADADRCGVDLCIHVASYGRMSDADLIAWYGRYGFVAREDGMLFRKNKCEVNAT
jgi:GNAT superfamily N-acetyltransferase